MLDNIIIYIKRSKTVLSHNYKDKQIHNTITKNIYPVIIHQAYHHIYPYISKPLLTSRKNQKQLRANRKWCVGLFHL